MKVILIPAFTSVFLLEIGPTRFSGQDWF